MIDATYVKKAIELEIKHAERDLKKEIANENWGRAAMLDGYKQGFEMSLTIIECDEKPVRKPEEQAK